MKRAEHINSVAGILAVLFLSTSIFSLFIRLDNFRGGRRSSLLSNKSEDPTQIESYLLFDEKEVEENDKADDDSQESRLDQNCVPLAFCLIGAPASYNPFAFRIKLANHPFLPPQKQVPCSLYRVLII